MAGFDIEKAFNDVLAVMKTAGDALPAVESVVNTFMPLFTTTDQATLKEALADARADNDEGYARLDAKLAAAAQRA